MASAAYTEDQIIALAPDAASVSAGKGLATAAKWVSYGADEAAIWGECKGSGSQPYKAQIDLHTIAFKCSCPSRKFPCKHGIGLFLLYSRNPTTFATTPVPEWVTAWLSQREARVEKAIEKSLEAATKPVDEEKQKKTHDARHQKILDGIEELQLWIKDIIRNGFLNIPESSYHNFYQPMQKRMVDAQANGLSYLVNAIGNINFYTPTWTQELLQQLTHIYLLSQSYKNIANLPESWQHEIRTLIGYPQAKETLLQQPIIIDEWLVVGKIIDKQDQLTSITDWLYGGTTHQFALLLQYHVRTQLPEYNLLPGSTIQAEVSYYQGQNNPRILVRNTTTTQNTTIPATAGTTSIAELLQAQAQNIANNPLTTKTPILLVDVTIHQYDTQYYWLDKEDKALPTALSLEQYKTIISTTGGKSCSIFGIYNPQNVVQTLSIWTEQEYIPLH